MSFSFACSGEVARELNKRPWVDPILDEQDGDPRALHSALQTLLASAMPSALLWGRNFRVFYNDAARSLLGERFLDGLGRPLCEVWPQVWREHGERYEQILREGGSAVQERVAMPFMAGRRSQERYYSVWHHPLTDREGKPVALIISSRETTSMVFRERRDDLLKRLALSFEPGMTRRDALDACAAVLEDAPPEIPWMAVFDRDASSLDLRRVMVTGTSASGACLGAEPTSSTALGDQLLAAVDTLEPSVIDPAAPSADDDAHALFVIPVPESRSASSRRSAVVFAVEPLIRFDDGYKPFLHAVAHCIGEALRKAEMAEQLSSAREARYRAFFDQNPVACFITTPHGAITSANQAACELLGYSEDELIGLGREGVVDTTDPKLPEYLAERHRNGQLRCELAFLHRDGHKIPCELFSKLFEDADGSIRTAMIVSDLTEKKQLEATLRQAQKMDAIGQLAGGVAHDFNNLLTVVHNSARFVLAEVDEQSQTHADIVDILDASDRAAALTRKLLTFSRAKSRPETSVEPAKVVSELETLLRRAIGEQYELTTSYAGGPCRAAAAAEDLEQVVLNLVVNARDAMPDGGDIDVAMGCQVCGSEALRGHEQAEAGCYVEIRVTDHGVGMSEETRERLFEPFYTTKTQGTGLGLSTVYGIVRNLGGFIEIDSTPGEGTVFAVYIPCSTNSARLDLDSEHSEADGGDETILLIEDDMLVRRAARRILERAGYHIRQAANLAEARQQHERGGYDVVVSDVTLPDGNGAEFGATLREHRSDLPIVLMSGYAPKAVSEAVGPHTAFVAKPFAADHLLRELRRVLDASRDAGS